MHLALDQQIGLLPVLGAPSKLAKGARHTHTMFGLSITELSSSLLGLSSWGAPAIETVGQKFELAELADFGLADFEIASHNSRTP